MKFVTQSEFARITGVNKSTVTRWIQNGRIELTASGLIDVEAAQRMREDTASPLPHHAARKAQIEEMRAEREANYTAAAKKSQEGAFGAQQAQQNAQPMGQPAAAAPVEAMPDKEKLSTGLKLETYKLQKAKAEMANLELDKFAGSLCERSAVDFAFSDWAITIRNLAESLPDRITPEIAACATDARAIHTVLSEAVADLLHRIADSHKRNLDSLK